MQEAAPRSSSRRKSACNRLSEIAEIESSGSVTLSASSPLRPFTASRAPDDPVQILQLIDDVDDGGLPRLFLVGHRDNEHVPSPRFGGRTVPQSPESLQSDRSVGGGGGGDRLGGRLSGGLAQLLLADG